MPHGLLTMLEASPVPPAGSGPINHGPDWHILCLQKRLRGSESYAAHLAATFVDTVFEALCDANVEGFNGELQMDRNVQQGGRWSESTCVVTDVRMDWNAAFDSRPLATGEEKVSTAISVMCCQAKLSYRLCRHASKPQEC